MAKEKKRVTASSLIKAGIEKGSSEAAILKIVAAKVPTSNADGSHVRYYAAQMFRNGEIKADQKAKYVKPRGRPTGKKIVPKKGKVKLKKVKKAA